MNIVNCRGRVPRNDRAGFKLRSVLAVRPRFPEACECERLRIFATNKPWLLAIHCQLPLIPSVCTHANDRYILGGRDVIARLKLGNVLNAEDTPDRFSR
jgi:hypothetical protein